MTNNIGILLAAGRGTRLQPFTDTTPKPLVNYNGKTLLEWNLEGMYDLVDYYVVVVHWLSDKIVEKIGLQYRDKKIIYAFQENPKGGTLDAFRVGVAKVETNFRGLIVANSDDVRGKEYYQGLDLNIKKDPGEPVIAAKIELDKTKLNQFGVIITNDENKYVEIIEKPQDFVSDLINIGLYYFPKEILSLMPKKRLDLNSEEYLIDLLNDWVKTKTIAVVKVENGFYKTVTRIEDLPKPNGD